MSDGGRIIAALGNSSCRLALVEGAAVTHIESFTHAAWREGGRVRAWIALHGTRVPAGICSVVPEMTAMAVTHFDAMGQPHTMLRVADAHAMHVEYDPPAALGIDRYCAAVGARVLCGSPVIAVDFGTAITVNVVDARGVFIGGAILPGYAAALRSLHASTALLPALNPPAVDPLALNPGELASADVTVQAGSLIGRTTEDAMRLGVRHVLARGVRDYVGAIAMALVDKHGALHARNRNCGSETPVYADAVPMLCTGGGAEHFLAMQMGGWRHHPGLVFVGGAEELRHLEAPNTL